MEKQKSRSGSVMFTCFIILISICTGLSSGIAGAYIGIRLFDGKVPQNITEAIQNVKVIEEESAIINVVKENTNAVVSVIVTKDLPKLETYYDSPFGEDSPFRVPQYRQNGTEEKQVGAGTGFLVSADGYIVTNRHVVSDADASYTVLLNSGDKKEAKVLARDTLLDIAVLKITGTDYDSIPLGDSDSLQIGQHVIAIGNALGTFQNTVSNGIVSGLSRSIIASGGGSSEALENIIQTDASINPGNSGGPLLDYQGNVIGVNVAVAQNAENIGFAIPINEVKQIIESVIEFGEIRRPYIGVRYVSVDPIVAEENNLAIDYGALVARGDSAAEPAVIPGSPADKAGLVENDIIIKIAGEKLTGSLQRAIQKHKIGDTVTFTILRKGTEMEINVKLEKQP